MRQETVEADVVCVGGGIAGLMAAIRAAELGARVVVAEKGNTLRSGAAGGGNDHFMQCYVPEVHGPDIESRVQQNRNLLSRGGIRTASFVRTQLQMSFEMVKLWDSWGIPMRPHGKWEFTGHGVPGLPPQAQSALKYAGAKQKMVLTSQARKRGVEIVNRVAVFDLLRDREGVVGAIGASTREDKVVVFKAGAVVLGTGHCTRLYPGPTPGWMFNMCFPPSTTGEGRAMAYRAGADLVRMEMLARWAGPKYLARCGKGTWIGVIRDPSDKPVGPFVAAPDRRYGDPVGDFKQTLFEDYCKAGKGPIYMDCRGISEDDYAYMMWGLNNEGNTTLLNHLKEEGIDIRENPIEFMTYELSTGGGILYNEKSETPVRGLYAAGDEYSGGIGGAAIFGWIAGESAARYAGTSAHADVPAALIQEKQEILDEMLGREEGITWQEANVAIQQVMNDYAGYVRSEASLRAGLKQLLRVRDKARSQLMAANEHELVHCLEVLSLFDIGESVFVSSLERKETRGDHVRSDYPFTDPRNESRVLACRRVDDKPEIRWLGAKELEVSHAANS